MRTTDNRFHRLSAYRLAMPLVCVVVVTACREKAATPLPNTSKEVAVYCSVDEVFARDVLNRFEARFGVKVRPVFDSEAGKTTGLINRIIAEAQSGRPRGDVLWSSELYNTILLARRGLLDPYDALPASDIPERFRDRERRWTALANRARVIAFDPDRTAAEDLPERWEQLAEPRYARITAIANPLFGTTRGHVAAMFALWGPERGRGFLTRLRDGGVTLVDGNSSAVRTLIDGRVALAMTDTDDVYMARRGGANLDLRFLDMGDGGTLLVPCSVAIIHGGPNPETARELVDYLVSAEAERLLAESGSRNTPVRDHLRHELGLASLPASKVDHGDVADAMDEAVGAVREILIR